MKRRLWIGAVLTGLLFVFCGSMAVAAGGTSYALKIAGTQVTDANRTDILGDGIFAFDGSKTLTVSGSYDNANADILIQNTGISGLTVRFSGNVTLHTGGSLLESSADTTLTGGTVFFSSSGRDYGIFVYGESTLKISCMRLTIDAGRSFDNAVAGSGSSQLMIESADIDITSGSQTEAVGGFGGGITLTGCTISDSENGTVRLGSVVTAGGGSARHVATASDPWIVSFDPGEGSGTMENELIPTNAETYKLPDCTFTDPENKVFAGWTVGSSTELKQPNDRILLTGNTTLKAQWETYSGYKIKVNGGYAANENGKVIRSATLGQTVYVYGHAMDGKYVSAWDTEDVNESNLSYEHYTASGLATVFYMPSRDVTLTAVSENQHPVTVNLNEGYYHSYDINMDILHVAVSQSLENSQDWFSYDLDENGTTDIDWLYDIYPLPEYSCGPSFTLTQLNSTPYYPITFTLDSGEHTVSADHGYVCDKDGNTVTSATPGQWLTLYGDAMEGRYAASWQTGDIASDNLMAYGYSRKGEQTCFYMPARNVTFTAELADQRPVSIDLTDGIYDINHSVIYDPEIILSIFTQSLGTDDDCSAFDLDQNGTADIEVADHQIVPLPEYSCGASFTLTQANASPYYPLTFINDNMEHTITVSNGYACNPDGEVITAALPGETVRIYGNTLEGQYVHHWNSDDTETTDICFDEYSNGKGGVMSFRMPARNVTLTAVLKNQQPVTIDLNEGICRQADNPSINLDVIASAIAQSLGVSDTRYDLDENGTEDVFYDSGFIPLPQYSCGQSFTLTKLNNTPCYPVTFRLNYAEYSIAVDGGYACDDNGEIITAATPGKAIRLYRYAIKGKYVHSWQSDVSGISEADLDYFGPDRGGYVFFRMPARNITLTAVLRDQQPITVDLSEGSYYSGDYDENIESYMIDSILRQSIPSDGGYRFDLDQNGTADIETGGYGSDLVPLPRYSCGANFTLSRLNFTPFYPMTIITRGYTVTFDTNGRGTAPDPLYVLAGYPATEPEAPEDDRYDFAGWYLEPVCSTPFDFSRVISSDLTLYAKWVIVPCTVSFDPAGGSGSLPSATVNKGGEYVLPDCPFTPPAGSEFWRWEAIAAPGMGYARPGDTIIVRQDITLTPIYRSGYTVSINRNGATSGTSPDIYVPVGQRLTLPECGLTAPAREGADTMRFDCWQVAALGQGQPGDTYEIHDDLTITPVWAAYYYVFFDRNGHGAADPAMQTVKEGSCAVEPEPLTESVWSFGGWYTGAEFSGFYDFSAPVTARVYLHALWGKKPLLTYYYNYPNSPDSTGMEFIQYGAPATERTIDPLSYSMYEPYVFVGWFADEELTAPFDFTAPIFEDTNLYGKWRKPDYTATFDTRGGGEAPDPQTVPMGSLLQQPADPCRTGFAFDAWYCQGSVLPWSFPDTPIMQDTTLCAGWLEPDLSRCLKLPAAIRTIEAEAFCNDRSYTAVIIPKNVTEIGSAALGCRRGETGAYVYDSGLFICGYPGTAAETYAREHQMYFVPVDDAWMARH